MTTPWFIAVERFDPVSGVGWRNYIAWSKLHHVEEVISFDAMLCSHLVEEIQDDDWPHIADVEYCQGYFTNLEFLRQKISGRDRARTHLLCVFRNPDSRPILPSELKDFQFCGFDLVEAATGVSALTNCGGWPELDNGELSRWGLIDDHVRAVELQRVLPENHPDEPHAECDVWAIFVER